MIAKIQKQVIYKMEARVARYMYRQLQILWKQIIKRIEREERSELTSDLYNLITVRWIWVNNKMDKDIVMLYMLWPKYIKKALDLPVDLEKINLQAVKRATQFKTFKPWLVEWSINQTTIKRVWEIVADGIFDWQTAKQIAETMESQLDKWLFSISRAETIAIHTVRHAHESWRMATMMDLKGEWYVIKKRRSTVNDDKVTPWCQQNQAKGLILINENFPSWDNEAPRSWNVRCRCTCSYDIQ